MTRKSGSGTSIDAAALESRLRAAISGDVYFDDGTRALYATDSSNYRQVPIGVVRPRNADDIVATIALCREYGAPILPRGAGTSLAGQCCNVAVVMDMSRHFNDILSIDPVRRQARVRPGVVRDVVGHAAEAHGLMFAPDPATHRWCTIGGMIGNNSCGVHSVMAGKTDDNVDELDVLTYDGLRLRVGATSEQDLAQIIAAGGRRGGIYAGLKGIRDRYADLVRARYPNIPRRVSGYNLNELLPERGFHVARALVGSEGTCVTVLEATLRLVPSPPFRCLAVLGYRDIYRAADHVPAIVEFGPIGLEGIDEIIVRNMRAKNMHPAALDLLPEGSGWLLAEFGGDTIEEVERRTERFVEGITRGPDGPVGRIVRDPREAAMLWLVRESGLGAQSYVPGQAENWEGWEDAAVPPERLGDYLRKFRALMARYGYRGALYGHFGQGCIHTRINFDLTTDAGIATWRAFLNDAADLVVEFGGSLSGEHGDGQARAELWPKMFGAELMEAFREFKRIWDPEGKMNPGKLIDAYRVDENLRVRDYHPPPVTTHFAYPDERGFGSAVLRCVGVGRCRRLDGGTMCPSYMVTREEKHSTRGRARLLFEMMHGEALTEGWRSEEVKEALDLCLSCKACKSECPVQVDMASYKAEFLSHYYEDHARPLSAYAFGFVNRWARVGSVFPSVANLFTQNRVLAAGMKRVLGLAPARALPRLAPQSFRRWFGSRIVVNERGPRVLLWPDTFNNFFRPDVAMAAVEVLEALGFRVTVPQSGLCCGRPLYDVGMLPAAKRLLHGVLDALATEIDEGVPIVGLEPGCLSVFRDELVSLCPGDERAAKLKAQSVLLSEFLSRSGVLSRVPQVRRTALVHGHCHQRAVLGMDDEQAVLRHLGLEYEILDSGCCGMAGPFGFDARHYDVSVQAGERVLLPAVRAADERTLIVTNGFSCHEQIRQGTGRESLHLAQLLKHALVSPGPV
jgi:FAD/FMN-containing dehydrogenase/Fe-S oxidoreductase